MPLMKIALAIALLQQVSAELPVLTSNNVQNIFNWASTLTNMNPAFPARAFGVPDPSNPDSSSFGSQSSVAENQRTKENIRSIEQKLNIKFGLFFLIVRDEWKQTAEKW